MPNWQGTSEDQKFVAKPTQPNRILFSAFGISLQHLQERLKQAGQLESKAKLDRNRVIEMLLSKIKEINWEDAKADMRPFIADPERLDIWSSAFFSSLIEHLLVES